MTTQNVRGPKSAIFWLLTLAYLTWIAVEAWANWIAVLALPIREWGNLLAGIFSPLAFLWLLYAALAQRTELELQREELRESNRTQRAQEDQLARQVAAMLAQERVLSRQADAALSPIFVLESSAMGPKGVRLHVRNYGSAVLDVQVHGVGQHHAEFPEARGQILPQWPKGGLFLVDMAQESVMDLVFSFSYRRLDGESRKNSYRYINAEQRIAVTQVILPSSIGGTS